MTVTFRRSVIGLVRSIVFSAAVWTSCASAETASRPTLIILPGTGIALSGPRGGPFVPLSFQYRVSRSTGVARILDHYPVVAAGKSKVRDDRHERRPVAFRVSAEALRLPPGTYGPSIGFTNLTNGRGSTTRTASLTINVPQPHPRSKRATVACLTITEDACWVIRESTCWQSRPAYGMAAELVEGQLNKGKDC